MTGDLASGSTFLRDLANLMSSSLCFLTFREKSSVMYLEKCLFLFTLLQAYMLVFFCSKLFFLSTSSLSFHSWKLTCGQVTGDKVKAAGER